MRERAPDRIIYRAIDIWKALLANPEYDNGASDPQNLLAQSLAESVPSNVTEERLDAFGEALYDHLTTKDEHGAYPTRLCVDYHPNKHLGEPAEKVEEIYGAV